MDYYREKSYAVKKQHQIAVRLSLFVSGLGQDFLNQRQQANFQYRLGVALMGLALIPFAFPITYTSLNSFLFVAFLLFIIQGILSVYSVKQLKKDDVQNISHTASAVS